MEPVYQFYIAGYVDMIKLVVDNGGDGCIADQVGDMPIHYAAIGCKPQAILTLVDKGRFKYYVQN